MEENKFKRQETSHPEVEQSQPITKNEDGASFSQKSGNQAGPIAGSIVVIIVLVLGGLYFIGKKVNDEGLLGPTTEEIQRAPDETLEMLQEQGTSDEVSAIEEDLDATILDDLDAELESIETELNF